MASRWPWIANLRETLPGARRLGERLMGISAKRSLPRWRRDTFWRDPGGGDWASREAVLEAASAGAKAVVLFVDTFNGTFERENAMAAARVLRSAGYRVHALNKRREAGPAGHFCCGRTFLAVGMVERARDKARELLGALDEFARLGIAIVGLEPSCLLTLRDETLVMGLGTVQGASPHNRCCSKNSSLARSARDDSRRASAPPDAPYWFMATATRRRSRR